MALLGSSLHRPAQADAWILKLPTWAAGMARSKARKQFVDSAFHKDTPETLKAAAAAHADTNPWHVMKAVYTGMQWELSAEWRSLSVPVLFLTGASDTMTPFSAARMAFDTVVAARMGLSLAQLSERQAEATAAAAANQPRNKSFAEVTTGPQRRPSMAAVDEAGASSPSTPLNRAGRAGSSPGLGSPTRKASSLRRKVSGVDGNRPVGVVTARVEGILVKGYSALKGGAQLAVVGSAAHQLHQEQPKVVNALLDSWMRDYALPRTRSGSLLNKARNSGTGDVAGFVTGSGSGRGLSARQLMNGAGMGGGHDDRGRSGSIVASLPTHFKDSVDGDDGAGGAFDEALEGLLPDSPPPPQHKTPPPQPAASRAARIAAAGAKGGSGGAMGASSPPSREPSTASRGGAPSPSPPSSADVSGASTPSRGTVKSYAGGDDSDSDSDDDGDVHAPVPAPMPAAAAVPPPAPASTSAPAPAPTPAPAPVAASRDAVQSFGASGDIDSDSDDGDSPVAAQAPPEPPLDTPEEKPKLPAGARKAPRGSRIAAMLAEAKAKSKT